MSTLLDRYLKRAGIGDADFAERLGCDRSMISKLRRGILRPTLDRAAAIEDATDGAVTMQSWTTHSADDQDAAIPLTEDDFPARDARISRAQRDAAA